jgi:hypothetical protein
MQQGLENLGRIFQVSQELSHKFITLRILHRGFWARVSLLCGAISIKMCHRIYQNWFLGLTTRVVY